MWRIDSEAPGTTALDGKKPFFTTTSKIADFWPFFDGDGVKNSRFLALFDGGVKNSRFLAIS